MTFQANYPDLDGLAVSEQVEELYNKFIALSREVEYAINHLDTKNFTPSLNRTITNEAGNLSSLQQTAHSLTISVSTTIPAAIEDATSVESLRETLNTASYTFNDSALNIYNAGIKIWSGTTNTPGEAVFYADSEGNLTLKNTTLNSIYVLSGKSSRGITFSNSTRNQHYGYVGQESDPETTFLGIYGGTGPFTYLEEDPGVDGGVYIGSNYNKYWNSNSGLPTEYEKKRRSGIALKGDVVINNFDDGFYRYPVISDANFKLMMYIENDALKVERRNAKTNAIIKTYIINPDEIV